MEERRNQREVEEKRDRILSEEHSGQGTGPRGDSSAPQPIPKEPWGLIRAVVAAIAVLMILMALVYAGEVAGLVAAALPGGMGATGGWVWGMIGLIGIVLLVVVIYGARSAGPRVD